MRGFRTTFLAALAGAAFVLALAPLPGGAAGTVPFVGCPSDGQMGPVAAPKGQPKTLDIDAASAQQLAWYQAKYSEGALAPRGWKCASAYGSGGVILTITQGKIDDSSPTVAGPAVVLRHELGGTSGRFDVAQIAARVFAAPEKAFVASVIAEGVEAASDFPSGPYPADSVTYKSPTFVEFRTPAGKDGLGALAGVGASPLPVVGVAKLVAAQDAPGVPDALLLAVRLPAAQASLAPAIVSAAEATLPKTWP